MFNKKYTVADLIVVRNYIIGKEELTPEMIKYYDQDGDGILSSIDYVKIKKILGLNEKGE